MPALDGMRVLDMTQYEAGTSCTQLLGWMGADIVKVEPPSGDPGRGVTRDPAKVSQYFLNYNGNKRSVVIDLSRKEGRDLLLEMAPKYDVFVENYGPGVIERLGIDYDAMKARNPGIIYARIKGFGTWGPYAGYNSYDWVAQAAGGTFSIVGEPDGPPVMIQPSFADSGTGVQMAFAIVSAYVKKLRTGEGEQIELSMQEAVTFFMKTAGLAAWGEEPQLRMGNRRGAPSGIYQCKGGGPNDYIFLFTATSRQWDMYCMAIGQPELADDPRYANPAARMENAEDLYTLTAEWCMERTKYEAMHEMAGAGVPCSAILDTLDLFRDPHLVERQMIHTVEHRSAGPIRVFRNPVLAPGSQAALEPAPLLGEHTEAVLAADLGLSDRDIAALRESGAIG
jgi:formyl-CoA transferase